MLHTLVLLFPVCLPFYCRVNKKDKKVDPPFSWDTEKLSFPNIDTNVSNFRTEGGHTQPYESLRESLKRDQKRGQEAEVILKKLEVAEKHSGTNWFFWLLVAFFIVFMWGYHSGREGGHTDVPQNVQQQKQ